MDWEEQRKQMVKHQLVPRGIQDARVLNAMRKVPRQLFVPKEFRESAFHDGPLSIGRGRRSLSPIGRSHDGNVWG
jgi:protein-L-isoaspartate(D-aspartate) O-methyltransferase